MDVWKTLVSFALLQCSYNCEQKTNNRPFRRSKEVENVTEIIEKIFKSYEKSKRPFQGIKPVQVEIRLGITSISHIMEEDMEFQASMHLMQFWDDPRLAYGNDSSSFILRDETLNKIWLPDSYVDNARKSTIEANTKLAKLYSNGSITYVQRITMTASAKMDFHYYPMDYQTLSINIYSYFYGADKLQLKWSPNSYFKGDLATFVVLKKILIEDIHSYGIDDFSFLSFSITVRRRLGYFIMQFYFPCVLCVIVSWLPFWMDRYGIGDRMALAIATLLTEVFLSQYINSSMPRVSYVKAADEFILVSFIFIFLALMESILVYNQRIDVKTKKQREKMIRNKIKKRHSKLRRNLSNNVSNDNVEKTERQLEENKLIPEPGNHGNNAVVLGGMEVISKKEAEGFSQETDYSFLVDQTCRVMFPLVYLIFIAYYFGRYLKLL